MIITKKEFDFIKAQPKDEPFYLNLDLGKAKIAVIVKKNQAILDGRLALDLDEKIKDNCCYLIDNQGVRKIYSFSLETNRPYKLIPTSDWPTISIGSVPMHKLRSPKKDSEAKISLIKPYGCVLDTCMGLGYTAILASKKAKKVISFEKDREVLEMARLNPYSQELFSSSNIEIRQEDVMVGVKSFESNYFDCIIHDPPTFKLAGELFSLQFYQLLMGRLKTGGKVFHYTPLYKIKQGVDFPSQVKKRLVKAGFKNINYSENAGGFLCQK